MSKSRIYIGNLSLDTEESQVKEIFYNCGQVSNIEFKNKLDIEGKPVARFAYLNLESPIAHVNKCVQELNGTSLNGFNIKVEVARESFLDRLKREREQKDVKDSDQNLPKQPHSFNDNNYNFNYEDKPKYNSSRNYEKDYSEWNDTETRQDDYNRFNSNQSDKSYNAFDAFNANLVPLGQNNKNTNVNNNEKAGAPLLKVERYSQMKRSGDFGNVKNNSKYDSKDNNIISAFKRYDPTAPQNQKKLSTEVQEQTHKAFAEVSSDLKFTEDSSTSFSLLSKFSEQDGKELADDNSEDEDKEDYVGKEKLPNLVSEKHKSGNFFIRANDSILQDGVSWLLTPLTEENKREFEEIRMTLLGVCRRRKINADRNSNEDRRTKQNEKKLLAKCRKKTDAYWERNKRNQHLRNDLIRKKYKKFNQK